MKKLRILPIILLCIMGISTHSIWAYPESRHSSAGIKIVTKPTHNAVDGITSVAIPIEAFPNQIAQDIPGKWEITEYTVYGNPNNDDTLTVGMIEFDAVKNINTVVYDHIKYVESIGGKMTGYAEHNTGGWNSGYVISWDVDGKHHYAKFCGSNGPPYVAYYDLEFEDGSDSQKYIEQLNDTLSLMFWGQ